ncbi:hypothetical protein [Mesorhizobium sp. M0074]
MHLSSPLAGAKAPQGRAAYFCVYHKIGYPASGQCGRAIAICFDVSMMR